MTTAKRHEVDRRLSGARRVRTLAGGLVSALRAELIAIGATGDHAWPSPRYRDDPVAFCRDVLGVEPWSKQIEVLEGVRDHLRVSVASGHKCGKSLIAVVVALWFYCSFEDARVVLTATTSRQVDQILWRELKKVRGRALIPIDGEIRELARSGLKADDYREIVGFTAREAEAVAGISGKNLLYIVDEASGVSDDIFEAIEGNRASGKARILMISNPTRTEGEFFRAFHEKESFYRRIRISSEETPNVLEGREVIPALAGRAWVEEKRLEWGEDSPLYKVRVRGEFVLAEDGKILSIDAIGAAEKRWAETKADGRLYLGVDPAGPGDGGDETVIAVRRGQKVLELVAFRGLSEDGIVTNVLGTIATHHNKREQAPVVVVDKMGPIGGALYGRLRAAADTMGGFVVYGVQASDKARRMPLVYDRVRDELWANLAEWIRSGGAVPEDTKLAKELHAPEWTTIITGKLKATSKDELRKTLGRSPDRADAVALSVWEPTAERPGQAADAKDDDEPAKLDPYDADRTWR